jgi:hypothetical protein
MKFSKEGIKEVFKEYLNHNIPIAIGEIWHNKFEITFAFTALIALFLSANLYFSSEVIKERNTERELQEAKQEILVLSKELKKYYLYEQDLIDAGATPEQAKDIIKSTEMLKNTNLAKDRLGK